MARQDRILKRSKSGEKYLSIAADLGVSEATVSRICREQGIRRYESRPPRTDIPMDDLAERYLRGKTAEVLAGELNCSPQTIYRRLRKAGVTIRSTGPRQYRSTMTAEKD